MNHTPGEQQAALEVLQLSKEQVESVGEVWALKLDKLLQQRNEDLVRSIDGLLRTQDYFRNLSMLPEGDIDLDDMAELDGESDGENEEEKHAEAPEKEEQEKKKTKETKFEEEPMVESYENQGDRKSAIARHSLTSMDSAAEQQYRTFTMASGRISIAVPRSTIYGKQLNLFTSIFLSLPMQSFFSAAILTNCVLIGVQVQYAAMHPLEDNPTVLIVFQQIYAAIFLIELIMQLYVEGRAFFCPADCSQWCWNYIDLCVVGSSLVELAVFVVSTTAAASDDDTDTSKGSTLQVLRILRIARLVRVIRLVRLIRLIGSLRSLIQSIISTMSALAWSYVLLFMIIYMFGIILADAVTTFTRDSEFHISEDSAEVLRRNFKDLHQSMITLFLLITNGADWGLQFYALYEIHQLLAYTLVAYVSFSMFAVLNVMTGTFCQFAIDSASRDQELMVESLQSTNKRQVDMINNLFASFETKTPARPQTQEGTVPKRVSLYDFESNFKRDEVSSLFQVLDIHAPDAWTLFKLLAPRGQDNLSSEEFVEGCMRLKGSAKKTDLAIMMHEQRRLKKKMENISRNINGLAEEWAKRGQNNGVASTPLAAPKSSTSSGGSIPVPAPRDLKGVYSDTASSAPKIREQDTDTTVASNPALQAAQAEIRPDEDEPVGDTHVRV